MERKVIQKRKKVKVPIHLNELVFVGESVENFILLHEFMCLTMWLEQKKVNATHVSK